MRNLWLLLLLALPASAGDPDVDALVDKLFDPDPGVRASARASLGELGGSALARILDRIEARQTEPTALRVYDVADLKANERGWRVALARVRAIAGAEVDLREAASNLVVRATPTVHRQVEKELQDLRAFLGQLVSLDARIVRLTRDAAAGRATTRLERERVQAFLDRHGAESLASPRLVCRNGENASISITQDLSYVSEFDLEVSQAGEMIADPVVQVVKEGVVAEMRPVLDADGSGVGVALTVRVFEVDRPFPTMAVPLVPGRDVAIQVPSGRRSEITTLVHCDGDTVAMLDLGSDRLLLLRAKPIRADERER